MWLGSVREGKRECIILPPFCSALHPSGSGVLVLTTTEVDKTGASYYGEQGLHYLSAKGEGNIVLLGKTTMIT